MTKRTLLLSTLAAYEKWAEIVARGGGQADRWPDLSPALQGEWMEIVEAALVKAKEEGL